MGISRTQSISRFYRLHSFPARAINTSPSLNPAKTFNQQLNQDALLLRSPRRRCRCQLHPRGPILLLCRPIQLRQGHGYGDYAPKPSSSSAAPSSSAKGYGGDYWPKSSSSPYKPTYTTIECEGPTTFTYGSKTYSAETKTSWVVE